MESDVCAFLAAFHVVEETYSLTGDGLGQQGLAGTGRADEQDALGQLGAKLGVLLGVLEVLDDLLQLGLGFVHAEHVLERDVRLLRKLDLGVDAHDRVATCQSGEHTHTHSKRSEKRQAEHRECGGYLPLNMAVKR